MVQTTTFACCKPGEPCIQHRNFRKKFEPVEEEPTGKREWIMNERGFTDPWDLLPRFVAPALLAPLPS
jgi:hypothetical protein